MLKQENRLDFAKTFRTFATSKQRGIFLQQQTIQDYGKCSS